MKKLHFLKCGDLLYLLLWAIHGHEQERITVPGMITDAETSQPLTGVTILVEGTATGNDKYRKPVVNSGFNH